VIGQLTLKHSALNAIKQQEAQIKTAKLQIKRSTTETDTHIIDVTEHPDATVTRYTPKAESRIDEVHAPSPTNGGSSPFFGNEWRGCTATLIVDNLTNADTQPIIQIIPVSSKLQLHALTLSAAKATLKELQDVIMQAERVLKSA